MLLKSFASQVLETSNDEVLSSGWVSYPSVFNALIKEFFPDLQLEFSLCVACDGDFSVFTERYDLTHHAVICWLLGSCRSGVGKNGFWSAVTSIFTSCCIFPTGF